VAESIKAIEDKRKTRMVKAKEPRKEFITAVCKTGTASATCDFCGCFHFNSEYENWLYEDMEEEVAEHQWNNLLIDSEKDPEHFIYHGDYSISCGELDGLLFVEGCPCNHGWYYQRFIWSHRYMIVDFLSEMEKGMWEDADDLTMLMERLDGTELDNESRNEKRRNKQCARILRK